MQELKLVRPLPEHRLMCEAMMDEWEAFGGRMNPGAIRRFSNLRHQNVTYEEWLKWTEEERRIVQDLWFFMTDELIVGAISIRYKSAGVDGHSGFGIRPSQRNKGYATQMLSQALPIMKSYGISPVILSCARDNIGSAKTIRGNGGRFVREAVDDEGEILQIYHIE